MHATTTPGTPMNLAPRAPSRYDGVTIALHWLTALLVVALFGLALTFNALARGTPLRHELQLVHVSCGLLLALVFVLRLIWRVTGHRAPPPANQGVAGFLARGMHNALYLMLAAQIVLGFLYRWAQGEEFTFFGLFAVPPAFAPDRAWARSFDGLHFDLAWVIIIAAGGHALMALVHHYARPEGLIGRMLPGEN